MVRSLAVLMDAIESIKVAKDTSFALLLEAERRGYRIHYLTQGGLAIRDGTPWARLAPLSVRDDAKDARRGDLDRLARIGRDPCPQGPTGRRPIHL